jgi:S1-C subfamily serine protease
MLDAPFLPILDPDDHDQRPAAQTTPADGELLDAYSEAVAGVADSVGPAVVRVDTRRRPRAADGGVGSGVIISPDGLVLTNSHVVSGAGEIRLADAEGRTTDAQLIGEDPDTDLMPPAICRRPTSATRRISAVARSWSPSAIRWASSRR